MADESLITNDGADISAEVNKNVLNDGDNVSINSQMSQCNYHSLESLRAAVERHAFYAETLEESDMSMSQIREKLKLMEKMFDRYMDEFTRVMRELGPNDETKHGADVEEVETTYFRAVSIYQDQLEKLCAANIQPKEPKSTPNMGAGAQDISLERIKPPKFNGNYAMWNEWRAMFDSLVHNNDQIHPTQKFHYLKTCTVGDAAKVLQGWMVVGGNYQNAYDALVELYENKYRIVLAHLEELTSMKVQETESYHGLRDMIDTVNRSLRQLSAIGTPVQYWDQIIIHIMLQRVSPKTRSEWENQHDLTEMPTLKDAMKFMERRARSIISVGTEHRAANQGEIKSADSSTSEPMKGAVKPVNTGAVPRQPLVRSQHSEMGSRAPTPTTNVASLPMATVEQRRGISCYNCAQPHPLYRCDEILRLGMDGRMAKIRELNLCMNCFSPNHPTGGALCKFGACRRCNNGSMHNSILCPMLAQQQSQQQQIQVQAQVHAVNTGSGPSAASNTIVQDSDFQRLPSWPRGP